jgi:hypothetical protein
MIYAQFYHRSTGWNGKDFSGPVQSIPLLGSDGVLKMDGRKSLDHHQIVAQLAIKHHLKKDSITGYQIIRAERFTDKGQNLTAVIPVVQDFPPVKVD